MARKRILSIIAVFVFTLIAAFAVIACENETEKDVYDMSGVVFNDTTVEYDGEAHSIIATNLPSGVTATYEGNGKTEVGVYTITAHFTGDSEKYKPIPDMTATLTISTEGFIYKLNDDSTYTVTGYDGSANDVLLPKIWKGLPVTIIDDEAFFNCYILTSVTIPDSVTSIGDKAFFGCWKLTNVIIGNSVTSIGSYAFSGCYFKLTSIAIPDSVTSIGTGAFSGCDMLASVTIGNSVTSIGSWTFEDCSGLTMVTIGNSVTRIEPYAFSNCSALKTVYYGGTVEQWYEIRIFDDNDYFFSATRYYYSEDYPYNDTVTGGNYWYYDDNHEPQIWTKE